MTSHVPIKPSPLGTVEDNRTWVQRWLIWPKVIFFALTMFVYVNHSFETKFLIEELKMSYIEASLILSLSGLNFFGAILWTWLADKTAKHKIILIVCTIVSGTITTLLAFKPFDLETQKAQTLAYVLVVTAVSNFFKSSLFPLMDSLMMTMLSTDPFLTKEIYGRQRLFSSLGHFMATLISALILDFGDYYDVNVLKTDKTKHYDWIFYAMDVCGAIFIVLVFFGLPSVAKAGAGGGHHHAAAANEEEKAKEKEKSPHFLHPSIAQTLPTALTPAPPAADIQLMPPKHKGWWKSPVVILLTNFNFIFFMLFVITAGLLRSVMSNFQTLYTSLAFVGEKKKSGLKSLRDILPNLFRTGPEIVVLLYGKQLIKWLGVYWVLVLSQFAGLVRVFGYAIAPPSEEAYFLTFLFESFKGLNSGLLTSSTIRISNDIAPKHCATTAQGLTSGTLTGIAPAVCGLLCALFFRIQLGVHEVPMLRNVFLWMGGIAVVFTVLLAIKFIFFDRLMGVPGFPRKFASPGHPVH